MKIVSKLFLALPLLLLVGCNEPKPDDEIAKVISHCGTNSISITEIKGRKTDDGFMQAQIIGNNSSGRYEKLNYRIVWLDGDGFEIDSILSKWRDAPAHEDQPFYIKATSPNTKAKSFRVYIKKDKELICDKRYK